MTVDADVFLCIIMGFGLADSIFMADPDTTKPLNDCTVQIQDIVNIFKANHCYGLVCTPKIFIIHVSRAT